MKGRASIFRGKENGQRVVGVLTAAGGEGFEICRGQLNALYRRVMGEDPTHVSDADVIEYLVFGEKHTREYLRRLKRQHA